MHKSRSPTVCVIIAARNAEATVGRAIVSALAQSEAAEVVVIDDGSTDETAASATRHGDGGGRLRVISLGRNVGPAAARNEAIRMSSAPFICVLDADDFFLPGRLAKLLAAAEDGTPLVADDLLMAAIGAEAGPYHLLCAQGADPRWLDLRTFVAGNIFDPRRPRGELGFLKPLMRRSFLEQHALAYDPTLRLGEDYALYAAALARGTRIKLIASCGYVALIRPDSLSNNHTIEDLRALVEADDTLMGEGGLSAGERSILQKHQESVDRRLHYRECLDAKRKRQWRRCAASLLKSPSTTRFILAETWRAKLGKFVNAVETPEGARQPVFYPSARELTFIRGLPTWSQLETPDLPLLGLDWLPDRPDR